MSNYPPGAAGNPNAPWNRAEPPECGDCGNRIPDASYHANGCSMAHMDAADIVEADEAAHAEMKLDEKRLEGRR